MFEIKVKVSDGKAAIYSPYNKSFANRIKVLGAKWDADARCWVVDESALKDARAVMRDVYGQDDRPVTESVDVILHFCEDVVVYCSGVEVLGRTIATAFGRDSGAKVGEGVMFLQGQPRSGGSAKNWQTIVPAGCVVKLPKLPKEIVVYPTLPDGVRMEVEGSKSSRVELLMERDKLLARLEEIDQLLASEQSV